MLRALSSPTAARTLGVALVALVISAGEARAWQAVPDTAPHLPEIDPRARLVDYDSTVFGEDPTYRDIEYDYQAQLDIYGAKYLNPTQRPLLELGRDLYQLGPFSGSANTSGGHNVLIPQLMVYGDFRISSAYNDTGTEVATVANRLNLDVDLKLTATERIHATFRPLDDSGEFTRIDFKGETTGFKDVFDAKPEALFFEGDLGAILGGLSGRDAPFDLPFSVGLMPLLFHNGIWIEDAFTGLAFTLPAMNSAALDWSNYDITFFAGLDRLSNPAFGAEGGGRIFGFNTFIEAYRGYIEAGYAYVDGEPGSEFHSVALSFTKRLGATLSNSIRYIGAFGQKTPDPGTPKTAGGHLLLIENSLITSRPYTVVPYFNLFVSTGRPVPAAKDPGAGGILKNTGLNFESDGLTGFPTIAAAANDVIGGALGLNLLGSGFNRQLVLEAAITFPYAGSDLEGEQFAFGLRGQQPLTKAIILRVDAMYGKRSGLPDLTGVRLELRHKF